MLAVVVADVPRKTVVAGLARQNSQKAKMKKIALFFAIIFAAPTALAGADYLFPDVAEDHPHADAIYFLEERGVIDGYDDGNFGPSDPVSRVQALKILLLGAGDDPDANLKSNFPDVPKTHWGQRFVARAAEREIVAGDDAGTFRPDAILNRAEATKILLRGNDISPGAPTNSPFADVAAGEWFAPFAEYSKNKKLVDDSENFDPAAEMTRADFAEMMYRLMYINENELDDFHVANERKLTIKSVYDGDTFTSSTGEKLRLIGVDTPEKGEDFDPAATKLVKNLILDKEVTIKVCPEKRDRYGRTLAQVFTADGRSVGRELISAGLAREYIPSKCGIELESEYLELQQIAEDAKLGIWSGKSDDAGNYFGECGTKNHCTEMSSCAEARYFLNECGLESLDADGDGTPCESLCE